MLKHSLTEMKLGWEWQIISWKLGNTAVATAFQVSYVDIRLGNSTRWRQRDDRFSSELLILIGSHHCNSLAFTLSTVPPITPSPQHSMQHKKWFPSTYPKEKFPSLIPSFDPKGVVCVGVDVGGLDLEDVRWHRPVRLDAHVLVDNWWWETLALSLRPTDTATANTQQL